MAITEPWRGRDGRAQGEPHDPSHTGPSQSGAGHRGQEEEGEEEKKEGRERQRGTRPGLGNFLLLLVCPLGPCDVIDVFMRKDPRDVTYLDDLHMEQFSFTQTEPAGSLISDFSFWGGEEWAFAALAPSMGFIIVPELTDSGALTGDCLPLFLPLGHHLSSLLTPSVCVPLLSLSPCAGQLFLLPIC